MSPCIIRRFSALCSSSKEDGTADILRPPAACRLAPRSDMVCSTASDNPRSEGADSASTVSTRNFGVAEPVKATGPKCRGYLLLCRSGVAYQAARSLRAHKALRTLAAQQIRRAKCRCSLWTGYAPNAHVSMSCTRRMCVKRATDLLADLRLQLCELPLSPDPLLLLLLGLRKHYRTGHKFAPRPKDLGHTHRCQVGCPPNPACCSAFALVRPDARPATASPRPPPAASRMRSCSTRSASSSACTVCSLFHFSPHSASSCVVAVTAFIRLTRAGARSPCPS